MLAGVYCRCEEKCADGEWIGGRQGNVQAAEVRVIRARRARIRLMASMASID